MNTNHIYYKNVGLILGMGSLLTVAGCMGKNPALKEARMNYEEASKNPEIVKGAPVALHDAKQTLDKASELSKNRRNKDEVTHMAYLVNKKLEIAEANANHQKYEEALGQASQSRGKVVLDARNRELTRANKKMDAALLKSKNAEDRANFSQSQALDAESALQKSADRELNLQKELADLKSKESDIGTQLTLRDMMFEVGKSELTEGGVRDVSKIALIAKQNPNRDIVIEGHTDSTGSESINQELSERRAKSVENILANNGIDAGKITIKGYGKSYPIASNKTRAGRQLNRRVVVTILREGKQPSDLQGNQKM